MVLPAAKRWMTFSPRSSWIYKVAQGATQCLWGRAESEKDQTRGRLVVRFLRHEPTDRKKLPCGGTMSKDRAHTRPSASGGSVHRATGDLGEDGKQGDSGLLEIRFHCQQNGAQTIIISVYSKIIPCTPEFLAWYLYPLQLDNHPIVSLTPPTTIMLIQKTET